MIACVTMGFSKIMPPFSLLLNVFIAISETIKQESSWKSIV